MIHLTTFPATYWLYPVSYYLMTHVYSKMSESLEDIEKIVLLSIKSWTLMLLIETILVGKGGL